ncbi:MAG: glutamyl-tRNA reductase [Thermoplasmata archaeon]|jgi:glutamyl-tRNA reductase|nr:glutamyl-tRNA reductase [Euryarchaeota archaeon]MVT35424.1 glutamyl-tRNA reductase [Euryarchaeota archaeon]
MKLISFIATYKQMSLKELEIWSSINENRLKDFLSGFSKEFVILKTCNRFEIYAILDNEIDRFVQKIMSMGPKGKIIEGEDAIRHLVEVASGMDSMIPGEQDIQRQVKEAITKSMNEKTSGKYLNYIFMRALSISKEVRSKTRIGNGIISLPQASVKILQALIPSGKVAIVGTGRVANTLIKYLNKKYEIDVFGRNDKKLEEMSKNLGIKCININNLNSNLDNYDALFSAIKMDGYILKSKDFIETKPYVVVDLGNPRNIENPGDRYFIDLDYLKEYVSKNISIRMMEMEKARNIIDEKMNAIMKRLMNYQKEEIIASIYERAKNIADEEVNELIKYIGEENRRYVEKFSKSFIKKIFGNITKNIKEGKYDDNMINELRRILG